MFVGCEFPDTRAFKIEPFYSVMQQEELRRGMDSEKAKYVHFLLEGFRFDEEQIEILDKLVCEKYNQLSLEEKQKKHYFFSFYRKTSKMCNENIAKNPRDYWYNDSRCVKVSYSLSYGHIIKDGVENYFYRGHRELIYKQNSHREQKKFECP